MTLQVLNPEIMTFPILRIQPPILQFTQSLLVIQLPVLSRLIRRKQKPLSEGHTLPNRIALAYEEIKSHNCSTIVHNLAEL